MHGDRASNWALLEAVVGGIERLDGVECVVCVPFPYLGEVAAQLAGARLAWGAQNLSEHARGAFTGEVSASMLAEFVAATSSSGIRSGGSCTASPDAVVAAKYARRAGARHAGRSCA